MGTHLTRFSNGHSQNSLNRRLFLILPAIALLMALTFTAVVYASFEGSDGNLTSPSGEDWENAPTLIVAKDKPSGKSDDS